MITEYCDIDIARLIECVKKRPLLYDKSQTDYSNVVLRDQTWIEIAKEVTSTGTNNFFIQINSFIYVSY